MELAGCTILVTGAAGVGVGAGVCEAIAEAGGRLVINDLSPEAVDNAVGRFPGAIGLPGDISKAESVSAMFESLAAQNVQLSGLVNNAGIGLSKPAHEAAETDYDRLLGVDLRGVWLMCRAFTRHVVAAGRPGSIVNISSVHAALTMARYALYASTKAGVEGLTRGLAVELGPLRIRCNAVAPGYVHSDQNRALIQTWAPDPDAWVEQHTRNQQALEHEIAPIDCGWAAVFLLSDKSRSITGQTLRVDAGMSAMLYNKDFL